MVKSIEERFWHKVDKKDSDECWNWKGAITSSGYGEIYTKEKPILVHRLSWELHRGPVPKVLLVLHRCDNKRCVNPSHLYLGTYSDNIRDAFNRGRRPFKLSDDDVREIRRLRKQGVSVKRLSKGYGVGVCHIRRIINRESRIYVTKEE